MELPRITSLLQNSFDGHPWHGPSVMDAVANLTEEHANFRLRKETHSINELVLHMAAWRNFVVKKLKSEEFEMTDALNFPGNSWTFAKASINQSQTELLTAIRSFPENRLAEIVPGREYDFYTLIHGIIQHDIYHVGQIVLIKKGIQL